MRVRKTSASLSLSIPALGILALPLSATDCTTFVHGSPAASAVRDLNNYTRLNLPDGSRLEKTTSTRYVGPFERRTSRATLRTLAVVEVCPSLTFLLPVEYTLEVSTTTMPMPKAAPFSAIVLVA